MKTILIDLDGVLNEYDGNFDEKFIPFIKPGAKEFIKNLSLNYKVKIFKTRNKLLVSKWLIKNELDKYISDITNIKELSWVFIDDRCINFDGNYKHLSDTINKFKPWYKSK